MTLNSTAGSASAESYFSIADADAYFLARGVTAWTGATAAKEAAARLGTSYLDNVYRGRWVGLTATETQALAWPRVDGSRVPGGFTCSLYSIDGWEIASDTVPAQVQRAAMEAALLALGGTSLEPTLERGGQIKSKTETVGPITESTTWADGAPATDRYTVIDGLLRGLVQSLGNIRLVRS